MRKCWEIGNCNSDTQCLCAATRANRSLWQFREPYCRCAAQAEEARRILLEHREEEACVLSGCRAGDSDAVEEMIAEYEALVRTMSFRFFLPGADREDLHQEGMTGLLQAVLTFEPSHGMTFPEFAALCIRNALVRAVRMATRKKHQVLSRAEDLDGVAPLTDPLADPARVVTARLLLRDLGRQMARELSDLEYRSLLARARGASLSEIGSDTASSPKQVENALFRARQKMMRCLYPEERRGTPALQPAGLPADSRAGRPRRAAQMTARG